MQYAEQLQVLSQLVEMTIFILQLVHNLVILRTVGKKQPIFLCDHNLINTTLNYISISTSKNYQSSLPPSFLMVSNQDEAFS